MMSDGELLRRYAEQKSEEAFAELATRHIGLVYSAALRQVNGDAALAEDIAQSVFTDLACKAASLARRPALTGWLYTSTHFAAAKMLRMQQRRRSREQEAHTMYESLQASADVDWEKIRPVLDQVMHELKASDQEAILLRYFENRPLADVGAKIGVSENAARMRVDRALEKLRSLLSRRGITTTAALSLVLSTHAIHAVPAGLAATLTSHSLAGGTAGAGIVLSLLKIIAMKKMKFSIIAIIALFLMGTTAFVARQIWSKRQPPPPAITVQTRTAAEPIAAESPEATAPSISGVWRKNVAEKPYLDLQFDGKGGVSGTVVWYDGPRTDTVPIEIGTFDPKTGALRLEGETPGRDGAMLRYVIAGTLENDTLSGSFGIGSTKTGNFAFTK